MKRNLAEFDQKYDTLIDYFAIIGFDNTQLLDLIEVSGIGIKMEDINIVPSVLERYPKVDRPKIAFPDMFVDFFFSMEERVLTLDKVNQYIAENFEGTLD